MSLTRVKIEISQGTRYRPQSQFPELDEVSNGNVPDQLAGVDAATNAEMKLVQGMAELDGLYAWKRAHLMTLYRGAELSALLEALERERKANKQMVAKQLREFLRQQRSAMKKEIVNRFKLSYAKTFRSHGICYVENNDLK